MKAAKRTASAVDNTAALEGWLWALGLPALFLAGTVFYIGTGSASGGTFLGAMKAGVAEVVSGDPVALLLCALAVFVGVVLARMVLNRSGVGSWLEFFSFW